MNYDFSYFQSIVERGDKIARGLDANPKVILDGVGMSSRRSTPLLHSVVLGAYA